MKLNLHGVGYHVTVDGEGPALLLLHGFAGSTAVWKPFLPLWSRFFRVIGVDIIGHGHSDAPKDPSRYAMEMVSADLRALLDHLEVDKAYVLGYSMGGRLALSFALLHQNRVGKLVLESSSPGLKSKEDRQDRRQRDEALADRIEREGMAAFVRFWEELPLFATQKRLPEQVRHRVRTIRLNQRAHGLAASLRGMGTGIQPSWWDELHRLEVPVALITGGEDAKFHLIAEEMKKSLPSIWWFSVPAAGHTVHDEQSSQFESIVIQFLSKTDTSCPNLMD